MSFEYHNWPELIGFAGFSGIGHNDWITLLFVWIIPNGAWVVLPAFIMYALGEEILEGLESATKRKR